MADSANALENAVEFVEAVVVDHQLALATLAVGDGDPGAQRFGQLGFQRGDVRLLCACGAGLARGAAAGRQLAGGELLGRVIVNNMGRPRSERPKRPAACPG